MKLPRPIRIVGCGSDAGDDGLGWAAIDALRVQLDEDAGIELHALGGGERLIDLLDGQGTLLLVDALQGPEPPGSIRRLEWPWPAIPRLRSSSTHAIDARQALELAAELARLPRVVMLFGVTVKQAQLGRGLSPEVSAALPALLAAICRELAGQ